MWKLLKKLLLKTHYLLALVGPRINEFRQEISILRKRQGWKDQVEINEIKSSYKEIQIRRLLASPHTTIGTCRILSYEQGLYIEKWNLVTEIISNYNITDK